MTRWLTVATALIVALLGLDFAWHYSSLPPRVASHFDAAGNANGAMDRFWFAALSVGVSAGMGLLFWGIAALVPRLPAGMINLPRRDFWLAAENRPATTAFIRRALALLGLFVQVHLAVVLHLSLMANLGATPSLGGGVWIMLAIFLAVFIAWIIYFVVHFHRPSGVPDART